MIDLRVRDAILAMTAADIESMMAASNALSVYIKRGKELQAMYEDAMVAIIEANGPQELPTGPEGEVVRYYIGNKRTTKCVKPGAVLELLLTATDGDFDKVVEHFASQPFKYGACKQTLSPEGYAAGFEVTDEPELKEGKPKLQKLDTRFLR